MSDQKESIDNNQNTEEEKDNRLIDGDPKAGIVPLGEVARVDWVREHIRSVKESEDQGLRW